MYVHPTKEQQAELLALADDQPVYMLNLIRFAEQANPGFGCDAMTGEEAYNEYGRRLRAFGFAGEPVWVGAAGPTVIGAPDEDWDRVLLVRYNSAAEFMAATSDPRYREAAPARDAAVADSRLILCNQMFPAPT